MTDTKVKKPKRPAWEKKAIRAIQAELGSNYTTALREWEKRGRPDLSTSA